jgi:hypothetical protein
MKGKKAEQPCYNKDYCDDVQKVSHDTKILDC